MMKESLLLQNHGAVHKVFGNSLTKKDILDHELDSSEILHKLTEKSLLQQAAEKKTQTFLKRNLVSLSLFICT